MKSNDSIETRASGTSNDLLFKKEESKCNTVIKQCENYIIVQKKTKKNIIQID